jgi:hypothetical protein
MALCSIGATLDFKIRETIGMVNMKRVINWAALIVLCTNEHRREDLENPWGVIKDPASWPPSRIHPRARRIHSIEPLQR